MKKELFLQSRVVAECHTASKNILNKKIREYVVVHMCYTRINYIRKYYTQLLTKIQCYKRVTHEVTHCHDRVTHEVT
jgi:hypothetical protein